MTEPNPFTVLGEKPIPEPPPRPEFSQRIQRAHDLSEHHASAAELLHFYARLAFYQQHVFETLRSTSGLPQVTAPSTEGGSFLAETSGATSWPLKLDILIPLFSGFSRSLAEISPTHMRSRASALASKPDEQIFLITHFWNGDLAPGSSDRESATDRFIALAFLQPYAEWLAQSGHSTVSATRHATCPICASEPICAVLRDQDHGARRSLVCSLCMNEWVFPRVVCPACGEDRFESLPVFTPQEIPHVRIDACETCHHYIKTIDMTKDGLAVPVVDELAAISLDLWASDNGYQKLTPNLAGI
jgi:formate dehydrogenase accessory protein FdhE